jgi:rhodanese-related sulfurtransferase
MLKPLSPFEVRDMLAKGARLIDIRSPGEFASERIAGSENMPLPNVPRIDSDKPVIFSCLSGGRVASNAMMLQAAAGGAAYELTGSLMAWKQAGLPVETGPQKPGLLAGLFGRG